MVNLHYTCLASLRTPTVKILLNIRPLYKVIESKKNIDFKYNYFLEIYVYIFRNILFHLYIFVELN